MIREEMNLRSLITKRLIECYRNDPEKVAMTCDTALDRSGNILGWIRDLNQILRQNEKKSSEDNSELSTCPCCHAPALKKSIPSKVVEHENDSGYMERSTLPGTSTYRYVGLSDGEPILPRTIDTKSVIELQSTIVHLGNIIQRDYLELLHTRRKIANQRETLSTLQANFEEVKRDNDIEITSLRAENDKLWELFKINGVDDDDEPLVDIAKFRIKASEEVNLQLSEKLEQSQKRIEQLEEEIESWKKLHQSNSTIFDKVVQDREILRSRIPVGSVVSNLTSSYDEISDVLYISFGDPRPSTCKEVELLVLGRISDDTKELSGLTILDCKYQLNTKMFNTREVKDDTSLNSHQVEFFQCLMDRYSEGGGIVDLGSDGVGFIKIVEKFYSPRY